MDTYELVGQDSKTKCTKSIITLSLISKKKNKKEKESSDIRILYLLQNYEISRETKPPVAMERNSRKY